MCRIQGVGLAIQSSRITELINALLLVVRGRVVVGE